MTALLAASITLPSVGVVAALVVVLTVRVGLIEGSIVGAACGGGSKRGAACRSRASERVVNMTGVVATAARSPPATPCR